MSEITTGTSMVRTPINPVLGLGLIIDPIWPLLSVDLYTTGLYGQTGSSLISPCTRLIRVLTIELPAAILLIIHHYD